MLTLPPVVKNLLIINGLMLLATIMFESIGIDMTGKFSLFHWYSGQFEPYQFITYMFMHANLGHILANMFALWMFGRILEQVWGPKRFLIFYIITGIGAAMVHLAVTQYRLQGIVQQIPSEVFQDIQANGYDVIRQSKAYVDPVFQQLNVLINMPMVGASGSVFGILLAFGMLFPNMELMMLFFPVPIKAKYFVMGYGLFELYMGFSNNPSDNVAHFAHLGGMLFGYILIRYWRKTGKSFY